MRVFAISMLYGSNLIQIYRVDSGHTVSLLARSSQHYLVVVSVFFEVQLAGTRSQSNSRIRGWGLKSANERRDHRQKHQKPRRQSCVVQPLLRLSYKTRFGIFFNAYSYFFVFSHEGSMSPFMAELSSHVSSPKGKIFIHLKAFEDCADSLLRCIQVSLFWFSIFRSCATRH